MSVKSEKEIRVGIIGCGGIAFGKHMPGLSKLPKVEMAAFCDIVEERAGNAAKKYGGENPDVYTDYRRLLEDKSIEVVHICTPNKSHILAAEALEAGKHVMCEKPMAKNTADARVMLEAAERTGKKLTIGYQNRFRADSQYLHRLCENGELGDIYYARAHAIRRRAVPTWGVFLNKEEQGGGPLIDIGTHALDLTLWMMNNYKVKSVMGSVFHKLSHMKDAANAWGPWEPEKFTVEDSAFGYITMQNGAVIVLEASWALNTLQTGEAKTTLCGTLAGADMLEGLRINGEKYGKLYVTKPGLDASGVDFYSADAESAGDLEARWWIECVLNDGEPVVKPREALVVTEILEAIYESGNTGKPVFFDK